MRSEFPACTALASSGSPGDSFLSLSLILVSLIPSFQIRIKKRNHRNGSVCVPLCFFVGCYVHSLSVVIDCAFC